MKNIIILDQSVNVAGAYGIGRFVKILQQIFNPSKFKVYLIDTFSTNEELEIVELQSITKIIIPSNGDICIHLLSLHINTIDNSIIFFNYGRQFAEAKKIKQKYVNMQLLGVLHSFSWMWYIHGNEQLLNKYMIQKHNLSDLARKIQATINKDKENFKSFDKLISLSNDSFNILNKIYNVDKTKLSFIPLGIKDSLRDKLPKDVSRDELSLSNNERIIIYVGRLDLLKGVDILIKAFNRLINNYKYCRLVFIGDGRFDLIINQLERAASRVTFTGRISQNELLLSGKTFLSLKKTGLNPFRNSTLSLYFVVPTQTNESDAQKYTFYRTATILPVIKFPRQARN